ncbi:hypothetical protein [Leptospira sp. GIMC2001]|uniref:hypothetical protein n=1 Tax=Leptospira sp. GIMC2001 TaxID=1513297 RepID=UPI00234B1DBF|nr:hypothetical protein [Leptospira sp. GIMC2001]WCL47687.1 hypothetical protein O4O04_00080 [Leptospira sp. GIMC2001]
MNPQVRNHSIIDKLLGFILLTIAAVSIYHFSTNAWNYFLEVCPNTDVLTWDENIRLNNVLDQYSDFRDGNIFRAIHPFLESPTWPPLRSIITLGLLYIPTKLLGLPENLLITEFDSLVGLLFLIASFVSIALISYLILKSWLYSGVITLSSVGFILQTYEVPAYSMSSMLETQSMFFLIWSIYFLYKLYEDTQRSDRSPSTKIRWGLGLSLVGFFFTKYPYGLMLFIAILFVEILRSPGSIGNFIRYAMENHYKGIRRIFFLIVVLTVLSLPFLRLFGELNLNQRPFKLFLYYFSLPVFLDFNYFLWSHRKKIQEKVSVSIQWIYLLGILPCLFWIYTNPDRVSSLIDAQMIVNHYTKSFFLSLVSSHSGDMMMPMAVFDEPWAIRILLVFAFLSISIYIIKNLKKSKILGIVSNPLLSVSLILFMQLLILETTTGNKQLRHILQFLPSLVLLLWVWVFQLLNIRKLNSMNSYIIQALVAIVFLVSLLSLVGINGLWANRFFGNKHICLRGEDANIFEPARWIAAQLPENKNLILFNGFHDGFNYDKSGRLIASEIDLKIRLDRYKTQKIRNDNKHKWKTWSDFDELVFISYSCKDENLHAKLAKRAEDTKSQLQSIQKISHPSGEYCLERYKISNLLE